MKINKINYLTGPNLHSLKPTIRIELDLEELEQKPSNKIPGFTDRLLEWMPTLHEHTCSPGYPGGFVERLREGTWMGHILEHMTIELQVLAGISVSRGKTITGSTPGIYYVTYAYKEKESGIRAFYASLEIVEGILSGKKEIPVTEMVNEISSLYYNNKLGPSTEAIYDAAMRRRIPVERIGADSYLRLGNGSRQKSVQATISSQTSYLAVENACDKDMTKRLLESANIAVPQGTVVEKEEDLLPAAKRLGYPLVLKPLGGRQGKGVFVDLRTDRQLQEAFAAASQLEFDGRFILERYYSGSDYRLLVVDGRLIAAAHRRPPRVIGDGVQTLRELIEAENRDPRRGDGHEKPMTQIPLEAASLYLEKNGLSLDKVPGKGTIVQVMGCANLSTGGSAIDVTDEVHPTYRNLAVRAAQAIGLDIAGIDMISPDVTVPFDPRLAVIIEVNAAPGIRMHLYPAEGKPRDAGEAIVDYLFPDPRKASVPVVAVTGTNGKTTTARLIAHLLKKEGRTVGSTNSDGVWVGSECIDTGDCSGPGSARRILSDPRVDVAVLETARGGILREGLAFRSCRIGVVTNVTEDHLGLDGIDTLDDLRRVKQVIPETVEAEGFCILNADDPRCVEMASHTPGQVVYFSLHADNPVLQQAIRKGMTAWYVENGWILCRRQGETIPFMAADQIPITIQGLAAYNVANALAALAAAHAAGESLPELARRIVEFLPSPEFNKGRFNLFRTADRHIIADYAHNPAGLEAVYQALGKLEKNRLITVSSQPGDRQDGAIRQSVQVIAKYSDSFVIKEDASLRGRKPLEVALLMQEEAVKCGMPTEQIIIVPDEREAFHYAWEMSRPGDLVLCLYDDFEAFRTFMQEIENNKAAASGQSSEYGKESNTWHPDWQWSNEEVSRKASIWVR